jgi:hypothetical protein
MKTGTLVWKIFLTLVALFVLSISANAQENKQQGNQEYTVSGTIKTADFQGNNYVKLTLLSSKDKKKILVWCSGEKTRVFVSQKDATWSELESGRKISVSGTWMNGDGGKMLWASRIDML